MDIGNFVGSAIGDGDVVSVVGPALTAIFATASSMKNQRVR